MSCCTNAAIACIFCRVVIFDPVSVATSCLISGDASALLPTRVEYHFPIAFQLALALLAGASEL